MTAEGDLTARSARTRREAPCPRAHMGEPVDHDERNHAQDHQGERQHCSKGPLNRGGSLPAGFLSPCCRQTGIHDHRERQGGVRPPDGVGERRRIGTSRHQEGWHAERRQEEQARTAPTRWALEILRGAEGVVASTHVPATAARSRAPRHCDAGRAVTCTDVTARPADHSDGGTRSVPGTVKVGSTGIEPVTPRV